MVEEISVDINEDVQPHDIIKVHAKEMEKWLILMSLFVLIQVEIDYYRHGGILQMVLRNKLAQ